MADNSIVSRNIGNKVHDRYEHQEAIIDRPSIKNGNEHSNNLLVTQINSASRTDLVKKDQDLKDAYNISDKASDKLAHRDTITGRSSIKTRNDDNINRARVETKLSSGADVIKKYQDNDSSHSGHQFHHDNIVGLDDEIIPSMHDLINLNNSGDEFKKLALTDAKFNGTRRYDHYMSPNKYQPKRYQNLGIDIEDLSSSTFDNSEKRTSFRDDSDPEVI